MRRLSSTTARPSHQIKARTQPASQLKRWFGFWAAVLGSTRLKQRTIIIFILLVIGGSLFVAGSISHAVTTFSIESIGGQVGLPGGDLKQILINIIRWVLGIVTLAAVGYMIYGGILWMTSTGNEQRIEKAKQVILQAAIGLVIILLAWAIVFFVVRTFTNVTTNSSGNPVCTGPSCCVFDCDGSASKFDVVAINTCAPIPPATAVPRSSAVSFTFNSDLKTSVTAANMNPPQAITPDNDPIKLAVEHGNLKIEQCLTDACTTFAPSPGPPAVPVVPATMTTPQTFTSGNMTAGPDPAPLSEWLVMANTLTFYHLTSDTPPDKNFFKSDTSYLVTLPKGDGANADGIRDIRDRLLSLCRANPDSVASDIAGCEEVGNSATGALTFKFKTGTDIAGQGIKVNGGTPSNDYKRIPLSARVDRAVPLNSQLAVFFDGGIDPITINTNNIQLFELNTIPDNTALGTCGGAECTNVTQVAASLLKAHPINGNGAQLNFIDPSTFLKPFQWYKVVVKDIRNLCGTGMEETPYYWVFQTNNTVPGVDYVYPENEGKNYCPSTPVLINYNTSMWDPTAGNNCQVGDPNSHSTQAILVRAGLTQVPGSWGFIDLPPPPTVPPQPVDLNRYCKHLTFRPTTDLTPNSTYNGWTAANMATDGEYHTIEYGDIPTIAPLPTWRKPDPAKAHPWHFDVTTADACYQKPYVTSVIPGQDANGACISVSGGFFEKPAPRFTDSNPGQPEAGDRLDFSTVEQKSAVSSPAGSDIKSWSNTTIVNKLNTGSPPLPATTTDPYHYRVSVNYPSPIGVLSSDDTTLASSFVLDTGSPSNRPCLYSLSPNQGPPGTTDITATGDHFGTVPGTVRTTNIAAPIWPYSAAPGSWTESKILGITVPLNASHPSLSQVSVRVGLVNSNPVDFNVTDLVEVVTGTPTVVFSNLCNIPASQIPSPNPYQDLAHTTIDNEACINTAPTVRFTLDIDPASMSGMTLWQCPGGVCNALPANQVTGVASAIGTQVKFTPASNLTPDMLYEVRMTNAMRATVAAGGKAIVPYTWQFRTRAGAECLIDGVTISPVGPILERNATFAHGLSANTIDNACHTLTHNGVDFNWTQAPLPSTTARLQLPSPPHQGDTNVIVPASATLVPGSIDVRVGAQSRNSSILRFTYDPTACTSSSQCTINALGESCGTPACINGHCEPVLNELDHNRGAEGNMITIKGCWFGAYGPQSKVKFAPDLDGQVPDLAICGSNTWGNERIYRQVPTGVQTGDVTVVRDDAVISNARPYTQTADLFPGLCQINPNFGLTGDNSILHGFSLGTKAATDVVNLRQTAAPNNSVDATDYPSPALPIDWANQLITFNVPGATSIGFNDVKVKKGTADSNSVLYNTLDGLSQSCTQRCTFDAVGDAACAAATPGTACSYPGSNLLGCCAPRPVITDFKPDQNATNICRNTVAQITFDRPLDQSTITVGPTGTVQYQDGINIVNGSIGYRTTATNEGEITYYPGLLRAGPQIMSFARYIPSPLPSTFDLLNPSFETVDANGLPTDWGTGNGVTTQADPAPNLSGHSILADCSAAGCAQAYAAQTQLTPDPQGTTYRVTAWVRTEQTNGVKAGLITACMGSNSAESWSNCGYDPEKSGGTHPGIFTQSTGAWKHIDFIVTKTTNDNRRLHIDCYANTRAKVWCDEITVTKVVPTPQATEIRGANGVLADTTRAPLRFTVGVNICTVDRVGVEAADTLFTAINQVASLEANAYSNAQSAPITSVDGLYTWQWSWKSQTPAVARTVMSSAAPDNPSQADVTALANGTTTVTATAKIGLDKILTPSTKDRTIDGQANVRVAFCVDPWRLDPNDPSSPTGFTDSSSNCDLRNSLGQCENYNFSMSYCRDTGGVPLPNFNYTGSLGAGLGSIEGLNETDAKRLKTFFFKESATSRDTIGLLIFKNEEILSPYDWFRQRFPLDTSGSSTVIGGYPAVKSGTTTYIGVTNYRRPFLASALLEGLMFVFDYNSNNASPQTVQIANQMIDTMVLNQNLSSSNRNQLIRDTGRRQDMTSMKLLLNTYRTKNGAYPTLTGGSYIPGFTTSKWPSWQTTLGSELAATIPSDPVNTFGYPTNTDCTTTPDATYEASTCWSETKKQFTCPNGLIKKSQIYGYRYSADSVNLYANMEFNLLGATFISPPPLGICAAPNSCDCFNFYLPVTP